MRLPYTPPHSLPFLAASKKARKGFVSHYDYLHEVMYLYVYIIYVYESSGRAHAASGPQRGNHCQDHGSAGPVVPAHTPGPALSDRVCPPTEGRLNCL